MKKGNSLVVEGVRVEVVRQGAELAPLKSGSMCFATASTCTCTFHLTLHPTTPVVTAVVLTGLVGARIMQEHATQPLLSRP
jgi:hypothetical protein